MANKESLIVIHSTPNEFEANVIKSHLESEGIPAMLECDTWGRLYGLTYTIGAIKILVPKEFAEEARQIIKPRDIRDA